MQNEVEESLQECRNAEEKAKKAITDVSRLVPCSLLSHTSKDSQESISQVTISVLVIELQSPPQLSGGD